MALSEANLAALDATLRGDVLATARELSQKLTAAGIPHAIVGGIAVGAHGWARATKDIDILVPSNVDLDEITGNKGRLIMAASFNGRTVKMNGVIVDFLSPAAEDTDFLDEAVALAERVGGLPIIPLGALVAMKMHASRERDEVDVIEVLKAAGDLDAAADEVRAYLAAHAPQFSEDFDSMVLRAKVDKDREWQR